MAVWEGGAAREGGRLHERAKAVVWYAAWEGAGTEIRWGLGAGGRWKLMIPRGDFDPRIHFALNCGAR